MCHTSHIITYYSTRSLCNSHNSSFVIHSFCYRCNNCILIHKTFISFHISTRIQTFSRDKASVVSLKHYLPHFFPSIVKVNKLSTMMLAGPRHKACIGEIRNACKILATKFETQKARGKHIRRRGESLIKI
jgi:hypothetical protein